MFLTKDFRPIARNKKLILGYLATFKHVSTQLLKTFFMILSSDQFWSQSYNNLQQESVCKARQVDMSLLSEFGVMTFNIPVDFCRII